jgi:23S rRNA pseudouridine2605 synthase
MSLPEVAERLQKALANLGLGSRREVEGWIRAGRLSINGRPAQLGDKVTSRDQLRLDGRLIRQRGSDSAPVLLCHRSPGIPLLPKADQPESFASQLPRGSGKRFISVSPLPQIDGGLELLTADGALATRLQRSVRRQPVEFSIRVRGEISEQQLERIRQGQLDRGATVRVVALEPAGGEGANRWYTLHAVGTSGNDLRQLLERQGVSASRVLRTGLGSLHLDRTLLRGRSRPLTAAELQGLLSPASPADTDPGSPMPGR